MVNLNPAMMGISPKQQAKAKQPGGLVEVEFQKRKGHGQFTVVFKPRQPGVDVWPMVDRLVESMAT